MIINFTVISERYEVFKLKLEGFATQNGHVGCFIILVKEHKCVGSQYAIRVSRGQPIILMIQFS